MYKIKGKGEKRDVLDGDRLVGRIVKHEYKSESVTIGHGAMRYSFTTKTEWFGEYPDGTPRHNKGAPVRVRLDSMKAWMNPAMWPPQ